MGKIQKTNWVSNFRLVGNAKIFDNTFKIDEVSDSGWQYNSMNLGVDCGEQYGTIYASMMGGFSTKNNNVLYVHGKKDDGTEDFKNQYTVAWEDRLDDEVLDEIGDFCFLNVGLEKTDEGKVFTQRFLSAYDAIAYTKEHIADGTPVVVRGNLKYSFYQDKVSVQREITSIKLLNWEENPSATFTQSILIDSESINPNLDIDKEKGVVYVHARVLDYVKEVGGKEVKGQYPLPFTFEYEYNPDTFKQIYDLIFKVNKGIRQVNFNGKFVNSGATIVATLDDVPDDIKALIGVLYTEEEVLTNYATQGAVERRIVLTNPILKKETESNDSLQMQIFDERYTEEDLEVGNSFASVTADDDFLNDLFG